MQTATAIAHPNIAFIKYWGDEDSTLRIPVNGSLSMNLDCLYSQTTVEFDSLLEKDLLTIDGLVPADNAVQRVHEFLNRVRSLAGISTFAKITSENNFPTGSGIASSASGFAALGLAASFALVFMLVYWPLKNFMPSEIAYNKELPEYSDSEFLNILEDLDESSFFAILDNSNETEDLTEEDLLAYVSVNFTGYEIFEKIEN